MSLDMCEKFWANASSTRCIHNSLVEELPEDSRHNIYPLFWFGDECNSSRGSGADVCFTMWMWTTGLGQGDTRLTTHVAFQIPSWRAVRIPGANVSQEGQAITNASCMEASKRESFQTARHVCPSTVQSIVDMLCYQHAGCVPAGTLVMHISACGL